LLSTIHHTLARRHGEAIYRFKVGMLPSDFFRRKVVLSFQEDAIGIRLLDGLRHRQHGGGPATAPHGRGLGLTSAQAIDSRRSKKAIADPAAKSLSN
jgi:hypothetical protein